MFIKTNISAIFQRKTNMYNCFFDLPIANKFSFFFQSISVRNEWNSFSRKTKASAKTLEIYFRKKDCILFNN